MRIFALAFLIEEIFLPGEASGEARGRVVLYEQEGVVTVDGVEVDAVEFVDNRSGDLVPLTASDHGKVRSIVEQVITAKADFTANRIVLSAANETAKYLGQPVPTVARGGLS